jgi:hypothetical protein
MILLNPRGGAETTRKPNLFSEFSFELPATEHTSGIAVRAKASVRFTERTTVVHASLDKSGAA